MFGSKKGLRDISRGASDISDGIAAMKIAGADPARALDLMEAQRDRAADQALKHQSKAKGIFNGPAELRAAKAAEATANQWQRKIDKHLRKHPSLAAQPAQHADLTVRLADLQRLLDADLITQDEYDTKRATILDQI